MKDNITILKESLPSFTVTVIILSIIFVFRPPFYILLVGLVSFTILRSLYKYYKEGFPKSVIGSISLEVFSLLAILLPIYFFYELFGASGLWSLVAVVLFLSGVILWRTRKQFVELLRDIERKHWGETREEKRTRLKGK